MFPKPLPRVLEKRQAKRDTLALERVIKAGIKTRDRYECRCCGRRDELEVHERKTRGAGGRVSFDNSLTLDRICHQLAQQYRIVIEGPTCDGPLRFVMSPMVASVLFDHRTIPFHVSVVYDTDDDRPTRR
jgi:hypothetical protein